MEKYSSEKAENEAMKMQRIIKDGYANNYSDAEGLVKELANTFGEAPREWQDFYVEMKELRGKLLRKIFESKNGEKNIKKLREKETKSIASVKDSHKYLAYHISCAGSTGPISSPKLDFDGEHSLLKFYEEFLQELNRNDGGKESLDKNKMSEDIDNFLEHELSTNERLTTQIKEACLRLNISFDDFKKNAHNYAMVFANAEEDNGMYNDLAISLANYHCMHMEKSYHRVRHSKVAQWLKQIDPSTITDCGYSVPSDYMLDKDFVSERKINLIEGSDTGEKVSRVIFDINNVPTDKISFESRNMNDFEYVGDSDAYVFLDSIEHTSNPDQYLKTQVSNAKNGSYFIFSIPICKIDSVKKIHFKEWLNDEDAKRWVEENGLDIIDSKLATPNPEVDIFARPIVGGFHNILLLCRKNTSYDSSPKDYVEGAKKFFAENPGAEKPTSLMLGEIRPIIKNANIADIGCGDAPNLDFYLSNGARHVSLIDPSKNIIGMAQERMSLSPDAERVDFSIGNFEENNLADENLDVAISRFSLHYNLDIKGAIKNIYKKLKKGGDFFIIVPHPDDKLNQKTFKKNDKDWVRINLYGTFYAEYPAHKIEEYFSDFVRDSFKVVNNRTFTYKELGLGYTNSNNAVLYLHLQKI